ncbi:MAG TPA: hypothetical protein VD902_21245 [Symbiobacteriaceae bacterium]|nr:hypothetical protein [Symbiobacteriaceae bacterium]
MLRMLARCPGLFMSEVWAPLTEPLTAMFSPAVLPAPTDVILSSENLVQPDILFVTRQRPSIINPAGGRSIRRHP